MREPDPGDEMPRNDGDSLSRRDPRRTRVRRLLVAAALLATAAAPGRAQEDGSRDHAGGTLRDEHARLPVVSAGIAPVAPNLDGRLDEAFWRAIVPIRGLTQTDPVSGAPSSERTEVWVAHDDVALYIAARLWDSSGAVQTRLGRRDGWLDGSDWFTVTLDSHHDHRTAYEFSVNPSGVKRDQKLSGGSGDVSWNAVWDAAALVDAEGWTVELRVPFSQLRFPPGGSRTWGMQVTRRISRLSEVSVLSYTPRDQPGGIPRFAHLAGVQAPRQGRRLEVQPYAVLRSEHGPAEAGDPFRDGSEQRTGAGLDVKYQLTSAITLDATANPDFAQVEADPAVVNLSAFETTLDEKRPFFVEGADIFRFQSTGRGLYYSRRIGRAPQGGLPFEVAHSERADASTILGAAKLSGRTAGGWSLGALAALTDRERTEWEDEAGSRGATVVEPRTGYLVGRLRRDLRSGQTSIGAIATAMHRDLETDALGALLRSRAYAVGLDFGHELAERTWSVEGSVAASHVAGSTEALLRTQRSSARYYHRPDAAHLELDSAATSLAGYAARLEISRNAGGHWRGYGVVSATSPGYEINDVGFQQSVDRISGSADITYVQNEPGALFRSWRAYVAGGTGLNYGGDVVAGQVTVGGTAQLRSYWSGSANLSRSFETIDDRLTRGGPAARDPAGRSLSGWVSSDARRALSGRLSGNYSRDDAGGWHIGTAYSMSLRPAENWSVSLGPRLERGRSAAQYLRALDDTLMSATFARRYLFAEMAQTTWSMESRLNVTFNPDLSLELYAQPFIAAADYGAPRQLREPRSFEFDEFGTDIGTIAWDETARRYLVDPDGDGPAGSFDVPDADFTSLSLRGNAVLRWEWRPGSTLFLVWQQRRARTLERGSFDLAGDVGALLDTESTNVFMLKANYWLNL